MMRRMTVATLLLLLAVPAAAQAEDRQRERVGNLLAVSTKLLASGVFVSGRTVDDMLQNDLAPASMGLLPIADLEVDLDEERKRVTLTLPGFEPRTAVYLGDQGCTLLPEGEDAVFFEPLAVTPDLPDPATQDWPMGDRNALQLPEGVDSDEINAILDFAFDDSLHRQPQHTRALVAVYDGHIIAERYAPGFDQDTRHISWSMGKSITSALIGVLVHQGALEIEQPAPIPRWHAEPDDPRAAITVTHLLHMSGGLDWDRGDFAAGTALTSNDDHTKVYFGAIDVFEASLEAGPRHEPGTVWRYLNCDTLSLGWLIKDIVEARGEDYLAFPQRALFDKLGMRRMVLECDPWGHFIMTGFNYATARDWARFGMLHVNDGVWQGERILPEGWVDFVRTPAPASEPENYGAQFWLNAGNQYENLPEDMFWAAGQYGQHCYIIPSRNLVLVRLGHSVSGGTGEYIGEILQRLLAALPESE